MCHPYHSRFQEESDVRVREFIERDRVLFNDLESEKNRFKANPESHADYTEEWRRFYNEKCYKHGEKIPPALLKSEWAAEWNIFLDEMYDRRLTKMREEIMDKLR